MPANTARGGSLTPIAVDGLCAAAGGRGDVGGSDSIGLVTTPGSRAAIVGASLEQFKRLKVCGSVLAGSRLSHSHPPSVFDIREFMRARVLQIEREIFVFKQYLIWLGGVEFFLMSVWTGVRVAVEQLDHGGVPHFVKWGKGVHLIAYLIDWACCACRIVGTLLFFGLTDSSTSPYVFMHLPHFIRYGKGHGPHRCPLRLHCTCLGGGGLCYGHHVRQRPFSPVSVAVIDPDRPRSSFLSSGT